MEKIEYVNAYSEVLEILKYITDEDYNKIPKHIIETLKNNANPEYKFFYNPQETLDEQKVSKRAKSIIAILFRDYWSTTEQKEKIFERQKQILSEIEKEKNQKYNADNIFEKRQRKDNIEKIENKDNNLPIKVKGNIFIRIINNLKNFIRR